MSSQFQQRPPEFSLDIASLPSRFGGRLRWLVLIGILVAGFVSISYLRTIYTDLIWFDHLGFSGVYTKILFTKIVLFLVGAFLFGVIASTAMYFAQRVSNGPEELPLPVDTRNFLRRLIRWAVIIVVIGLSVVFGLILSAQWEVFLRFGSGVSFETVDPLYGMDVSFYIFALPLYKVIQGWLLGSVIVVFISTIGRCFANFSFRGVGFTITPGLKVQISVIAAVMMFIIAAGHWLDRWLLVLSPEGFVYGAAYADVAVRKTAIMLMAVFAVAAGGLILVNVYIRGTRLLIGGIALWLVMTVVLGNLWPNAIQRFTVNPNEFSKEKLYIQRNIEATREAFGLADIDDRPYPVEPILSSELLTENTATIDNIRLWDRDPLSDVYSFDQIIRPYYNFEEADVDRYEIGGVYRQVMVAAREVELDRLASENPDSQTWVNKRLRYTHGFGIAMSPVTEFTPEGRPEYFAKDIPSDGKIIVGSHSSESQSDITISNSRIYYGEQTSDYVLVNTNTPELDYQASDQTSPKSINYYGTGGVDIGSFIRRAAYAWQFGDINILITGELNEDSRIQYRRDIQDRITTVAPFLWLDKDPYIVATPDGLMWIQDAYTITDGYPYSEPAIIGQGNSFNYIRNSVKVTVDAFNGSLKFYVWDQNDPLVRTYSAIFPDLFVSGDQMPKSLSSHVRYPQDMFGFQAAKYLRYHMQVPRDFYNNEDIWSLPREKFGQGGELTPVDPYYVIMKIPGEEKEEFVLLLPYTRNEPNPIMAGWIAARSDGDSYGQLVAFNFPKERRVKGPEQIEADIDTDEVISEWFTLRCEESLGSSCLRGNLLVVPVASGDTYSLLYAEPIYLQAESVEFPALKKVILATDEKVVMRDSVYEAVEALTGFTPSLKDSPDSQEMDSLGGDDTQISISSSDGVESSINNITEAIKGLKDDISLLEDSIDSLKSELLNDQQ